MQKKSHSFKKKRPESDKLKEENNEISPPTVDDQIEAEIRKDLVSIRTFDENKDGILDDNEILNAVSKAKLWAAESNRSNKNGSKKK